MARTRTAHSEQHFTSGNLVRDVVIGMSDGLTVPFALAAGLSGAVASTRLTIPRPVPGTLAPFSDLRDAAMPSMLHLRRRAPTGARPGLATLGDS